MLSKLLIGRSRFFLIKTFKQMLNVKVSVEQFSENLFTGFFTGFFTGLF